MADQKETVAGVAELYLGNILFALELAAINMDEHQKPADAAFYRGIARKLAEARGREVAGDWNGHESGEDQADSGPT